MYIYAIKTLLICIYSRQLIYDNIIEKYPIKHVFPVEKSMSVT